MAACRLWLPDSKGMMTSFFVLNQVMYYTEIRISHTVVLYTIVHIVNVLA